MSRQQISERVCGKPPNKINVPSCRGGAALSKSSLCSSLRSRYLVLEYCQFLASNPDEKHTSDSIVESLLGEMAGLIRRIENLIVEDGEIQGKTKTNRVSRCKISRGDLGCCLVGLQ